MGRLEVRQEYGNGPAGEMLRLTGLPLQLIDKMLEISNGNLEEAMAIIKPHYPRERWQHTRKVWE